MSAITWLFLALSVVAALLVWAIVAEIERTDRLVRDCHRLIDERWAAYRKAMGR